MRFSRRAMGLWVPPMVLACGLALSSGLMPSWANTLPVGQGSEPVRARFDPAVNETRLFAQVTPRLCVSMGVPGEWRLGFADGRAALVSVADEAELALAIRSARDLQHLPQSDLPSRDAALLQSDYESMLGRPAQAVSLDMFTSGVMRWTATWIDGQLPTASRALTVETFIVPLSDEWLVELSLDNVEARDAYQALARQALASLDTHAQCGP
ncbi:hypothetical protein [Microvirga pudoricolor]|uniref:hypothetical protein n=1 Tax=Microvirga pudoricolor TaxID=2778729 RepID=UPI00194E468F|nr:hypothetical protein [Microvirga pudoricolor]MBM6593070.1 hypothetical protein [Microvirga pudoricolor]